MRTTTTKKENYKFWNVDFVFIIYYSFDFVKQHNDDDNITKKFLPVIFRPIIFHCEHIRNSKMKMYSNEVIVCAILIGVVATISSIDASPSTAATNGRNFKENDILRDEDHGSGKHRLANNRPAASPLDVNNNNDKINDSDDVDVDASVGRFSVIDSDVENSDEDDDDADGGKDDGDVADTNDDDSETDEASIEASSVNQLSLKDQVHLLTRQLSALTKRQRSDYKSLEQHVRKSVRKATKQFIDELDMRHELEQLR